MSQKLHQIVESKVYCGAGAALHSRSRLIARESSKYLLFVEAKVESSTSKYQ